VGVRGLIAHRRCVAYRAGRLILDRITEGDRPKSGEIIDELGMNSAVLGRLLTKHRLPRPKSTTRGAGSDRLQGTFYTVEQIPEIDWTVHVLAGELERGRVDVLP
jgi:hypothetical protein